MARPRKQSPRRSWGRNRALRSTSATTANRSPSKPRTAPGRSISSPVTTVRPEPFRARMTRATHSAPMSVAVTYRTTSRCRYSNRPRFQLSSRPTPAPDRHSSSNSRSTLVMWRQSSRSTKTGFPPRAWRSSRCSKSVSGASWPSRHRSHTGHRHRWATRRGPPELVSHRITETPSRPLGKSCAEVGDQVVGFDFS